MKKKLLTTLLFYTVFFTPFTMRASDAATLADQISNFTGGGTGSLTAVASGNTVTVTGSLTDVTQTLGLNIDADVTVEWKADISAGSGFLSNWNQLIWLSGSGTFNVAAGSITATDDVINSFIINTDWFLNPKVKVSGGVVQATAGTAINTSGDVEVSGGEVSCTTGVAIQANGESSTVSVSGTGKVASTGEGGVAIETYGNVEVNGGEVSTKEYGGIAIISLGGTSTIVVNGGTVSAINTTVFTGGNVEVSDGEVSASSGGYAIYNYNRSSTVTVSGNGQVKSMIYTSGSIVVKDNAQVSATYGSAVNATGENSTVTVSGGTVSAEGRPVINMSNSNNTGLNVTVTGTGKVQATGNGDTAIWTYGNVEVSGGEVSSPSSGSGTTINAFGESSKVTVSGGTVSGFGGNGVIYMSNSNNTGLNVIVSGTGKVQTTGNGGEAIYSYGSVEVSGGEVTTTTGTAIYNYGNVEVNGGKVIATTGNAIFASGDNSMVSVSDGLVFNYSDAVSGVIYSLNNPSCFTGATDAGVVIGWNQAAGNTTYIQGTTTDISQSPASATVVWDKSGTSFGISYANGTNTGFIPLSVTVVSAACDIVSVESPAGATISGDLVTTSVANDVTSQSITLTTSPAASWKLFSDAACTNEITNKTMMLTVGENTAYIQVTAENGAQRIYTITVNRAAPSTIAVTGVMLDYTTKELPVGDFLQLTATVLPYNATNRNVSWSSSKSNVVTVSATGLVTAVGTGTANIIVTTEEGDFMAWCIVTVFPLTPSTIAVTGVTLDQSSASLWVGETQQLTAVITPSDATNQNVSWSSSNPAIATVSTDGLITAVGKGVATVTALTEDGGYKATCSVEALQQEVTVPDNTQPGADGKGKFSLSLTIPTDVLFSGSFLLTLPNGVQLDPDSTCLVSALAAQLSLTITQKNDSAWFFTIAPLGLRSATELVYSQIVEIGYMVVETVAAGKYAAVISDLLFKFDNGVVISESELPVQLTLSSPTGFSDVTTKTDAYLYNGQLYINSPVAEKVAVYSVTGTLLRHFTKPSGSASYPVETLKGSVLIIKGDSGWVKKVIESQ